MPKPLPDQHAHLTLAFVDVCNSTRLYETLGDDVAQQRIGSMLDALRDAAQPCGGRVIKEIGDESMIVFGQISAALDFAQALPGLQERLGLQCRCGIHSGEVIVLADDVYGDAVNTAARIVALAAPGQVLLSQASVEPLPGPARPATRPLPPLAVRGKRHALQLLELTLESDADYTQVVDEHQLASIRGGLAPALLLEWEGGRLQAEPHGAGVTIGRSPDNSISIGIPQVSRVHARIEQEGGYWLVHDQSTNGTRLQEQGARPVTLHRNHHRLLHAGTLTIPAGQAEISGTSIRYQLLSSSSSEAASR